MWMYDHLQKLFSTEVGMKTKYRPVQQSLNLLKSTTSKRQWLKIKQNSEAMPGKILTCSQNMFKLVPFDQSRRRRYELCNVLVVYNKIK